MGDFKIEMHFSKQVYEVDGGRKERCGDGFVGLTLSWCIYSEERKWKRSIAGIQKHACDLHNQFNQRWWRVSENSRKLKWTLSCRFGLGNTRVIIVVTFPFHGFL
ncbi:hypothetical protein QL285_023284 [Trifolium repens]|nr:hypothetical protein QL285_023284 [Trifolium repens]